MSVSSSASFKGEEQQDNTNGEELLRKLIRQIMMEEAEKLSMQKEQKVPEVVTAAPMNNKEKAQEQAPQPSQEHDIQSKEAKASSSPHTAQNQCKHQRSIQDVLDGTPSEDELEEDDGHVHYIHHEHITNKQFDATVKQVFPGALDNYSLIKQVASMLMEKQGCNKSNTLLATSFCCDEASRQLEDDLEETYGRNFNLGGLAGFPWAGQTGFAAMAHHIPEGGHCLLVYGPHVGITKEGLVGKVERVGICKPDTCCGSAVAASNYVQEITNGNARISTNLNSFTDFQQGAVQQMILPHCKRLDEANNRMLELPYALYESQDLLMTTIAENGASNTPNGVVLLGGIQINTGPTTPDYFHPLRFSYMNSKGEVVEEWLEEFCQRLGSKHDADGIVQRARESIVAMEAQTSTRRASEDDPQTEMKEPEGNIVDRDIDEEHDQLPEKMEVPPAKRRTCAQEPGGDHYRLPSVVTKSIDMTGVVSPNLQFWYWIRYAMTTQVYTCM